MMMGVRTYHGCWLLLVAWLSIDSIRFDSNDDEGPDTAHPRCAVSVLIVDW